MGWLRVAFLELRLLNFHGGKSPRSNVVERGFWKVIPTSFGLSFRETKILQRPLYLVCSILNTEMGTRPEQLLTDGL
jgi:hypothetical protein